MGRMRQQHQKRKEKRRKKLLMKNFVSFTATGVREGGGGGVGRKKPSILNCFLLHSRADSILDSPYISLDKH